MHAFLEGWRRILRAPAVTSGLLVGTLLAVTTWAGGRTSQDLLSAVKWILVHEVFGFGGLFTFVSGLVVSRAMVLTFLPITFYLVFWMFISGGVLDRLARNRETRTAAFFSACGVHFFRFIRLGALLALPSMLVVWVAVTMVTPHRTVVSDAAAIFLFAILSVIGDYAKVRLVVEDRHSAFGALAASVRFVARHPLQVFVLYALNAAVMMLAVAASRRFSAGPTPNQSIFLLVYSLAVLLQILARLSFMASSIALFQSKLAHAGYVAAPLPMWPDSPSAEALQNLIDRKNS
jgi:hypothetical protein